MLAPAQQIWSFFMQEITVDILTLRGVARIKSLPRQNYELELKYHSHHFFHTESQQGAQING